MQQRISPRRQMRGMRGLTLLELVIAVVILSIGTLAAVRATDQSRVSIGGGMTRLLATVAVQNRAEEVKLMGLTAVRSLPTKIRLGGQDFALTVETRLTAAGLTQVELGARAVTGEGAVLVLWLPAGGATP